VLAAAVVRSSEPLEDWEDPWADRSLGMYLAVVAVERIRARLELLAVGHHPALAGE